MLTYANASTGNLFVFQQYYIRKGLNHLIDGLELNNMKVVAQFHFRSCLFSFTVSLFKHWMCRFLRGIVSTTNNYVVSPHG